MSKFKYLDEETRKIIRYQLLTILKELDNCEYAKFDIARKIHRPFPENCEQFSVGETLDLHLILTSHELSAKQYEKEWYTSGYRPLKEGYKPTPQSNTSGEIKPPQGGCGETPSKTKNKKT